MSSKEIASPIVEDPPSAEIDVLVGQLFETSSRGLAVVTLDGRWRKVNRALCTVLGHSEQELLATTVQAITHPEHRERQRSFMRSLAEVDTQSVRIEISLLNKRHEPVSVTETVAVARGPSGAARYLIFQIELATEADERDAKPRVMTGTRRRLVAEPAGGLVVRCAEDGVIRAVSAGARAILGRTHDELVGEHITGLVAHVNRSTLAAALAQLARGAATATISCSLLRRAAEPLVTEATAIALPGALMEREAEVTVLFRDITERVMAEQTLRRSEANLRALVASTPQALLLIGLDGRILSYNEPANRITAALSQRELREGEPFESFVPSELRESFASNLARAAGGERVTTEQFLGGTWFDVDFSPVGEGSHVTAVCLTWVDIDARKRGLEALGESEARFRRLTENAPDVIYRYRIGPEPGLEYVSPAIERVTGYAPEAFYRDRTLFRTILEPGDRTAFDALAKAPRTIRAPLTLRWVRNDGTRVWVQHRVVPIVGANGAVVALEAVARDISMQVRVEMALQRAYRDLRQVIDSIPDGVAIHSGGKLLYVNAGWAKCFGCHFIEELIGESLGDLALAEDRERVLTQIEPVRPAAPRTEPIVVRFRRRDGEPIWLELSRGQPIEFEGESTLLVLARDVTERTNLEAQLRSTDRLVAMETLAAGFGHSISNPLAYVIGNLSFARSHLLASAAVTVPPQVLEALDDALEGAERVRALVQALKGFASTNGAKVGPVDVRSALSCAIEVAQNDIRHRARLTVSSEDVPPVIANEARLAQVFLDLLFTVARGIPEGAADHHELRVVVRFDNRTERVVVEVSDARHEGDAQPVEQPPVDAPGSGRSATLDAGLGLFMCRGIIAALGGDISAKTTPGQGNTFRVMLPAVREAPPPSARPPSPSLERHGARPRLRVLVIDDEPKIGEMLVLLLQGEYDAVAVTAAQDALVRLQRGERFDAIVCDLMMPVMTGMDLHAELCTLAPDQARRMIFVTGGAFTPRARAFLDSGAHQTLEKPFTLEALRAALEQVVEPLR